MPLSIELKDCYVFRFGDIMKMRASPKQSTIKSPKTEQAILAQASAKNKRLAEQMARRSGIEPEEVSTAEKPTSVKNRLGATKTIPTKARLGTPAVNRLGAPRGVGVRGRGGNLRGANKTRGFSPRGRSLQNTFNRGRRQSWSGRTETRGGGGGGGRGRGAGRGAGRGGGRGGGRGAGANRVSKATREDLDKELDSYMGVKKNHITFDSTDQ